MQQKQTYAFHHADTDHTTGQLRNLEGSLDAASIQQFTELGVGEGWHCLEIGAGAGSLAQWLADVVGPTGSVVATDLAPHRITAGPRLTVLEHDIANDPLPAGPYDLIHARLVLLHLAERVEVVSKLAAGLKPGGWLLLEDFDYRLHPTVLTAPDPDSVALFDRVVDSIIDAVTTASAAYAWGPAVYDAMTGAGLTEIFSSAHTRSWTGGTPGVLLHGVNTLQLPDQLRERGLTDEELERFRTLTEDPRFAATFFLMQATRGRRPGAA